MKPSGPLKHFVAAFFLVLLVYAASFYVIQYQRSKNGPWRVTFSSTGDASPPRLVIDEPRLNITNLQITFPGRTAPATNVVMFFDQPREVPFPVPFGNCVFIDAISMPGTVAFEMFGHEIQLLPRVLTIDKQERPWQSNTNIEAGP